MPKLKVDVQLYGIRTGGDIFIGRYMGSGYDVLRALESILEFLDSSIVYKGISWHGVLDENEFSGETDIPTALGVVRKAMAD